ncbi:hypothetical protein PO878_19790 [Iamia majanohamensis]|uniref:Uncharacterized protein n=1 Tax=Iamia majanohamensis TaxID=467976 RepID=A0AAE9YDE2_9ACTN|nr:hypothetical protein [Iamia majanohamensis]WCO66737.1 hypothetical protein PO878_19790 [Iamia majanohamensis]
MVAFVGSLIVSVILGAIVLVVAKRRPVGAELSWGEAMLGATFVFFGLFWVYGVVPHQWLTWAENELSWRPDAYLAGPSGTGALTEVPFNVSYETLSHLIAVTIYGVFLAAQIALWAVWQGRGDKAERRRKALEEKTTAYGRPLARKA